MKINLKEMNGGLGSVHMHHYAHVCTHVHTHTHTHVPNTFHTKMKQFKFLKSEARNEVRCGTFISPLITTTYDNKSSKESKITSA